MTGLIEELQRNVVSDTVSLQTILRQIKLAAVKLELPSIQEWVESELNGYRDNVPKYRVVRGSAKAFNPFRGWINIEFDDEEMSSLICEGALYHSIAVLKGWLSGKNKGGLMLSFPFTKATVVRKSIGCDFEVGLQIDSGAIPGVLAAIRNKALDWVIELERNGVIGSDFSFSSQEKERASTMTINNTFRDFTGVMGDMNTVGNISSNINNSKLDQFIKEAYKNLPTLQAAGVDTDAVNAEIEVLRSACGRQDVGLISRALDTIKGKLAEAGGNAIAIGLVEMIRQVAS